VTALATNRRRIGAAFRERLGFPPLATPIIMALGLFTVLGTTPTLFDSQLNRIHSGQPRIVSIRTNAERWLADWQTLLNGHNVQILNGFLLPGAMIATLSLIVAAAIRSFRAEGVEPIAFTLLAAVGGLSAVPVITWVVEAVTGLWRVYQAVAHALGSFIDRHAHVIGIVLIAVVAIMGLLGLIVIAVLIADAWLPVAIAIGALVAFGAMVRSGWLHTVGLWLQSIRHWLNLHVGHYLAIGLKWVVFVLLLAVLIAAILGVLIGVFGQIGRTVFLPLKAARKAGTGRGQCVDLAAGVGVTASVVLCGAAFDPGFGQTFHAAWTNNVALMRLPEPAHYYAYLIPGAAQHALAPAFVGYNPVIDCGLLFITASLGALSLLSTGAPWVRSEEARIFIPVLIVIGIAVAAVLPVILVAIWLRAQNSS
jgi:hypothetical protein